MALRIGGPRNEVPVEEPLPQEEAPVAEEPMPEDLMAALPQSLEEEPIAGGSLDPAVAVYRDPSQGPFMCSNCLHFSDGQETGSCDIVAGPIHAEGLCNIFESGGAATEEPMPEGEPYPEEVPVEEPAPEEAPIPEEEV